MKRLAKGDLVSIVSPSAGLAPFAMHRVENGIKALEQMGFRVKTEPNALKNAGYVSASVEDRVSDIHDAFSDTEVKAIICSIGGDHSNQLLPYLDWELIKKNPKILVGYSDMTVLLNAVHKKTGLTAFYGPCLMPEFGDFPEVDNYTKEYFLKALQNGNIGQISPSKEWTDEFLDWFSSQDTTRRRNYKENQGYEWWREGSAEGLLYGGCVPSLNHLAGTEYWNDLQGKILFIDLPEGNEPGTALSMASLDSYFADLYNLGVFRSLAGLVIGRPYQYKNYTQETEELKRIVLGYTKGTKYPILFGADIGHTAPMITIPLGAQAALNSGKNSFEIKGGFI